MPFEFSGIEKNFKTQCLRFDFGFQRNVWVCKAHVPQNDRSFLVPISMGGDLWPTCFFQNLVLVKPSCLLDQSPKVVGLCTSPSFFGCGGIILIHASFLLVRCPNITNFCCAFSRLFVSQVFGCSWCSNSSVPS